MSDFETAANYLKNTNVDLVTSTNIDLGTGEIEQTTTSYSLREIICSLLGGNGIKLPNLQLCLKINIGRLLGMSGIPPELYKALQDAEEALDEFIAHTNIDNVLGRLNAAIAEFAAIANMINFCGTPINPKPIPNVLKDMFGSYLGTGKNLLDKLGTMLQSDIGGCASGSGINLGIFQGGILSDLDDIITQFGSIANAPANTLASLVNELNAFSQDMKNLVKFENNWEGTDSKGGSQFEANTTASNTHTGVGTAIDTSTLTLSHAQQIAGGLKSAYSSLSAYEVDADGNNIFHYLLEPKMLGQMQQTDSPDVSTTDRTPNYDYCGVIIDYTASPTNTVAKSQGSPAQVSTNPGITGLVEAGIISNSPPSTTTNLSSVPTSTGVAGPAGPTGATGPAGPAGPQGPAGPSSSVDLTNLTNTVASLQTQINALQTELDTNQQSAENITTGVIARLNTIKSNTQGYITTWQAVPAFDTGDTTVDDLLDDLVAQLIAELQAQVTDLNAQITVLSEDFTI